MDFSKEFYNIANQFDLNTTEQKQLCHQKCHEFAKQEIPNILRKNEFMHYCSEKLHQPWIHETIFPPIIGNEQILLDVYDNRVIICGNKSGLTYLASVATTLSNSNLSGEHIHVEHDDEVKVFSEYEFEFMFRDDDWLSKFGAKKIHEKVFQQRNIDTEDIVAIMFLSLVPPDFSTKIERFEIYETTKVIQFTEKSPSKKVRENTERMLNVSFTDKNLEDYSINVDLDDLDIVLLTRKQIEKVFKNKPKND